MNTTRIFALVIVAMLCTAYGQTPPELAPGQFDWLVQLGKVKPGPEAEALFGSKPEWTTKEAAIKACLALSTLDKGEATIRLPAIEGAVALAQRVGGDEVGARALYTLGLAEKSLGKYEEACSHLNQALAMATNSGVPRLIAMCHIHLAESLLRSHRESEALPEYVTAIELFEKGDISATDLPGMYFTAGALYSGSRQTQKALSFYEKSIALNADRNPILRARCLVNMGSACKDLGDQARAKASFEEAEAIFSTRGLAKDVAMCDGNLGTIYLDQGHYHEAIAYLNSAHLAFLSAGDLDRAAASAVNIGTAAAMSGRIDEALSLYDAAYVHFVKTGSLEMQARCLMNIATALDMGGKPSEAVKDLTRAMEIFDSLGIQSEMARCSLVQSNILINQGKGDEATSVIDKALATYRSEGNRLGEANALSTKALAFAKLGKMQECLLAIREACAYFRSQGMDRNVSFCREYEGLALEELNRPAEAAVALDDSLSIIETLRGTIPDPVLATGTASHRDTLGATLVAAQLRLGHKDDALLRLERFKASALNKVAPGTASAASLTLSDLQNSLPPGTAAIEYAMGDRQLWILVLRKGQKGLTLHTQTIDSAQLRKWSDAYVQALKSEGPNNAGRQLYKHLIEPIRSDLAGISRLIICPDRFLHTVPFSALADASGRYLIEKYAITCDPSVAAWRACTLANRAHESEKLPPLIVAVSTFSQPGGAVQANRGLKLEDLPQVREEARSVQRVLGPTSISLIDTKASLETVTSYAPKAGLIHFASHAITNDASPDAGVLVLAPKLGGFSLLYPQDVRKWHLKAKLVVLSACASYAGRLASGEGLLSLAWSFHVAGCPTTIATRWKVDDRAAKVWVEAFYSSYAKGKGNADSFRAACLALLRTGGSKNDISAPRNWGNWALMGSDR